MNKHQKQVLVLCAAILLAMLLFPPFQVQVRGTAFNMGYHYIAEPPRRGSIPASVNAQMLLVQWVGVALLGAVAVLLLKDSPGRGDATPRPATSAPPSLSPTAPAASPPVDQSRRFLGGHHHPWRRHFARTIDSILFVTIFIFFVEFLMGLTGITSPGILHLISTPGGQFWLGILALFLMIPVEAALLSHFKTTPGKWLFGIEVTNSVGERLSSEDARRRSFDVWVKGQGLGIPLVMIIPMMLAYRRLTRTGTTLWDTACHAVVTHRPWTPARAIGAIATMLSVGVALGLMTRESQLSSPSVQETSGAKMGTDGEFLAPKVPKRTLTDEEVFGPKKPPRTLTDEEFLGGSAAKPKATATNEDGAAKGVPAESPPGTTDNYLVKHFTGEERLLLGRPGRTVVTFEEASSDRFLVKGEAIKAYKRGDFAAALNQLVAVANQGDAGAEFYVGEMLLNGQGVAKDAATAFQWYLSAANHGYMSAATTVGVLYLRGIGIRQDIAAGAEWLRRAADAQLGDGIAEYNLGVLNEAGLFGDADFGNAYAWYENSAAEARSDDVHVLAVESAKRVRSNVDINQAGYGTSSAAVTKRSGSR